MAELSEDRFLALKEKGKGFIRIDAKLIKDSPSYFMPPYQYRADKLDKETRVNCNLDMLYVKKKMAEEANTLSDVVVVSDINLLKTIAELGVASESMIYTVLQAKRRLYPDLSIAAQDVATKWVRRRMAVCAKDGLVWIFHCFKDNGDNSWSDGVSGAPIVYSLTGAGIEYLREKGGRNCFKNPYISYTCIRNTFDLANDLMCSSMVSELTKMSNFSGMGINSYYCMNGDLKSYMLTDTYRLDSELCFSVETEEKKNATIHVGIIGLMADYDKRVSTAAEFDYGLRKSVMLAREFLFRHKRVWGRIIFVCQNASMLDKLYDYMIRYDFEEKGLTEYCYAVTISVLEEVKRQKRQISLNLLQFVYRNEKRHCIQQATDLLELRNVEE